MRKLDFDVGTKEAETTLNDQEKREAALTMGMNAALVQFVLEGIIPPSEQLHFMMHVMDFVGRFYAGEDVKLPGGTQTFRLNSQAGRLYADAANDSLLRGKENAAKMKEAMKQALAQIEQPTNDENAQESINVTERKTLH